MQVKGLECATFNAYHPSKNIQSLQLAILQPYSNLRPTLVGQSSPSLDVPGVLLHKLG
jgi:hypothetical protein